MITETLHRTRLAETRLQFQTQLLKLYFLTTLYVDVKEPAVRYIWPQKKLNLVPTKITVFPPLRGSVFIAGTKLSPI